MWHSDWTIAGTTAKTHQRIYPLTFLDKRRIVLKIYPEVFTGELNFGQVHWDNFNVWHRVSSCNDSCMNGYPQSCSRTECLGCEECQTQRCEDSCAEDYGAKCTSDAANCGGCTECTTTTTTMVTDTAGWENNFGTTCETYVSRGICKDGALLNTAYGGSNYNDPVENCVACGKKKNPTGRNFWMGQWQEAGMQGFSCFWMQGMAGCACGHDGGLTDPCNLPPMDCKAPQGGWSCGNFERWFGCAWWHQGSRGQVMDAHNGEDRVKNLTSPCSPWTLTGPVAP